jgi:hypothetical protein
LTRCSFLVPVTALAAVQKRRELPTRVTQAIQLFAHRGFAQVFENPGPIRAPWQLKAAMKILSLDEKGLGRRIDFDSLSEQRAGPVTEA